MVTIEGTLNIKKLNGTKGAFCVGDLVTPVGTFKVKDPLLDQYEEGKYRGTFVVSQIYPASYVHFGKVITEVRAQVARIILDDVEVEKSPATPTPSEPDPADEGNVTPAMTAHSSADATPPVSPPVQDDAREAPAENADDADLFGADLYAAIEGRQAVKLDPTVDRKVFRAQRDRLKERGYRFEAALQTWGGSRCTSGQDSRFLTFQMYERPRKRAFPWLPNQASGKPVPGEATRQRPPKASRRNTTW